MREPKRITVAPDSELAGVLEEAKKTPLLLEKDGLIFRLAVDEEKAIWWGYYDPDETKRVLDEMVGTLPRDEADRMLAELNQRRSLNGSGIRFAGEDNDIWAGYDPEAVRKAVEDTVGSWADIDTEKLIADIYRWREEGSRPLDRP